METNEKTKFIWQIALIANIIILVEFTFVYFQISGFIPGTNFFEIFNYNRESTTTFLEIISEPWVFMGIVVSLFSTITPLLISKSSNRFKNWFGYCIPVLLLLAAAYFYYIALTCEGKFCGISEYIFARGMIASGLVFALLYTLGKYSKKLSTKAVVYICFVETLVVLGQLWWYLSHSI